MAPVADAAARWHRRPGRSPRCETNCAGRASASRDRGGRPRRGPTGDEAARHDHPAYGCPSRGHPDCSSPDRDPHALDPSGRVPNDRDRHAHARSAHAAVLRGPNGHARLGGHAPPHRDPRSPVRAAHRRLLRARRRRPPAYHPSGGGDDDGDRPGRSARQGRAPPALHGSVRHGSVRHDATRLDWAPAARLAPVTASPSRKTGPRDDACASAAARLRRARVRRCEPRAEETRAPARWVRSQPRRPCCCAGACACGARAPAPVRLRRRTRHRPRRVSHRPASSPRCDDCACASGHWPPARARPLRLVPRHRALRPRPSLHRPRRHCCCCGGGHRDARGAASLSIRRPASGHCRHLPTGPRSSCRPPRCPCPGYSPPCDHWAGRGGRGRWS